MFSRVQFIFMSRCSWSEVTTMPATMSSSPLRWPCRLRCSPGRCWSRQIHGRRPVPRHGRRQMGHRLLPQSHQRPRFVFVQVGDGFSDHSCWQRPEDMEFLGPLTPSAKNLPGYEVFAEIAAALAAASLVFRPSNREYSARLLKRARTVINYWLSKYL